MNIIKYSYILSRAVYIDAADGPLTLNFRMPNNLSMRMWEMSVIQLPFEQRAPAGCMQYFRSPRGTLKTLNYAPNGRYLADQDYLLCVRQESGMCSVAYTPCTNDSFRVGQRRQQLGNNGNNTSTAALMTDGEGSGTGPVMASPLTGQRCDDRVLIPCDFEEFITVCIFLFLSLVDKILNDMNHHLLFFFCF